MLCCVPDVTQNNIDVCMQTSHINSKTIFSDDIWQYVFKTIPRSVTIPTWGALTVLFWSFQPHGLLSEEEVCSAVTEINLFWSVAVMISHAAFCRTFLCDLSVHESSFLNSPILRSKLSDPKLAQRADKDLHQTSHTFCFLFRESWRFSKNFVLSLFCSTCLFCLCSWWNLLFAVVFTHS